ncbi:MFS transporter [Cryptosporangium phraense]|uniref:MFS transporter n=1 Tax=Cryptosporangium phraense TaxID=2593070 RepID=A0A545AZ64_9ACTN|nr:MFS transporter [Cryptosporangium phraense]TQS46629.1 MFS transporter [Cryptosporangium phraense]
MNSWRRDFHLLWTGTTLTQLGGSGSIFVYPLLALALTGSPVFAGWVVCAGMVPATILYLPAGVLADRLDRRTLLIVSAGVRGVAALTLPLTLGTGHGWAWLLPLVAFVDGTCSTVYATTEASFVPRLVPPDALSGAIARNEARFHLATLLGRPLGGLLFGLAQILPFVLNAVSGVAAAVLAALVRGPRGSTRGELSFASIRTDLRDGLVWVARHPLIRLSITHDTLQNFLMQAVGLTVIARAVGDGVPGWLIGIAMAAGGAGGVLGAWVAPSTLRGRSVRQVLVAVAWGWALFAGLVTALPQAGALIGAFVLYGLVAAHTNVAMVNYQAREVPPELLGRVVSVDRFLSMGMVPLGALVAGYALPAIGAEWTLLALAAAGALWAVVLTVVLRGLPAGVPAVPAPAAAEPVPA